MYATDPHTAEQLLTLLMPYLKHSRSIVSDHTKVHVLAIVRDCMRLVEPTAYHYNFLSQLFNVLSKREQRIALCEVCVVG